MASGWQQTAELEESGILANDHLIYSANFGYSVAISGTTIVAGSVGRASGAGRDPSLDSRSWYAH